MSFTRHSSILHIMCGILGIILRGNGVASSRVLAKKTAKLLLISESRGKEASGVAIVDGEVIRALKCPLSASELLLRNEFHSIFNVGTKGARVSIAHARLVTNGSLEKNSNNQPIIKDGIVGVQIERVHI